MILLVLKIMNLIVNSIFFFRGDGAFYPFTLLIHLTKYIGYTDVL